MNILINFSKFHINPMQGGVQRVYDNIAKYLENNDSYHLFAIAQTASEYDNKSHYSGIYITQNDESNIKALSAEYKEIIIKWNIDYLISPFSSSTDIKIYSTLKGVKVIHHWHNKPVSLFSITNYLPKNIRYTKFGKWFALHKNIIQKKAYFKDMDSSAAQIILSNRFRNDMNRLYPFNQSKIYEIPNPTVIDKTFCLENNWKGNTFLYVGRITQAQKRFKDVLIIWSKLQDLLPNWKLDILGDGPEKNDFIKMANDMGLKRITFHGFLDPVEFYKRSRCLLMTSNFEGFGMVLVEAMQYGCVPFAYNSFESLTDIIDNGYNGFIIPPFNTDKYVEYLYQYAISSEDYKKKFEESAIAKSKTFDIGIIWKKWKDFLTNSLLSR